MPHDIRKLFQDILDSAQFITRSVEGLDVAEFAKNRMLYQAVERNFEIVGEALNRIKKQHPEVVMEIGEHPRIIAFRNVLVHAYDAIDSEIVWSIIHDHLPKLESRIKELLEAM